MILVFREYDDRFVLDISKAVENINKVSSL